MTGYWYRCDKCGITWDEGSKHEAQADRDRHRHEAHGGGAPDGDAVHAPDRTSWPPPSILIAALTLFALFLLFGNRH
ncbi:hypothetical protein LE181_02185 [Streptomyces sp. SCA3-4]|uniref:hypothetical protein n=1 Tax=Streptomyces sichuanensis TaxID=2871810 RepID=UPI001CE259B6|nr:hypothetical protein [Streptomyces sichuanensis]MCA6090984.1 hypothetical protein [Streptomyces sichuanensis]